MDTQLVGTQQVINHHLRALGSGDLDEVIADYTDDSVLMVREATLKGRSAIRGVFEQYLSGLLKPGTYEFTMDSLRLDGDVAHLIWHARCASADVVFATDTFVVKEGKIALQTFAGKIEPR
ncbi:MAG TPA: nuclear transport factor 2 family protein [Candidatus Dormibacteraeota bacterium]|nr:nuclear transport factor 2 family protein [Candidatus Dormibacteraeota bacterium]